MTHSLRSATIGWADAGASAATPPIVGCRPVPGKAWVGGGKLAPSAAGEACVAGVAALASSRSARRLAGASTAARGRVGVSALEVSVRREGAAVVGAVAGGSAGRVVVPGKLKFWSSRGPIVSVAGALLVAGWVVSWASAEMGASIAPIASNIVPKRQPAFIYSRSEFDSPLSVPRRVPPMPAPRLLFKHRFDEPHRTQGRPAKRCLAQAQRASTRTSSESSSAAISIRLSPVIATPSRGPAATPFTRIRPLGTRYR